jgi:hypothetical protein
MPFDTIMLGLGVHTVPLLATVTMALGGLCVILTAAFLSSPVTHENSAVRVKLLQNADTHGRTVAASIDQIDFLPGGNATQIRGPALPPVEIRCRNVGALSGELAFACHAVSDAVVLTEVHMKCDPGKNMRSPCHVFYAAEPVTRTPARADGVRAIPTAAPKDDYFGDTHVPWHLASGLGMLLMIAYWKIEMDRGRLEYLQHKNESLVRRDKEPDQVLAEARAFFPFLWADSPMELPDLLYQWSLAMDAHRIGPEPEHWDAILAVAHAMIGAAVVHARSKPACAKKE